MHSFRKIPYWAKSLLLGLVLLITFAWLIPFLVAKPADELWEQLVEEKEKARLEQNLLLAGVAVQLAQVDLPPAPVQKVQAKPKPNVKQLQAVARKKAVAPSPRAKQQKQPAIQTAKLQKTKAVTVKPTRRLLAVGKVLLESAHENKELPQIIGDYSRIGFQAYANALINSGGKLVVYDWSGQYGRLPLVELDGKTYKPRIKKLGNYYLDRPRLVQNPVPELAKAMAGLRQRSYPKANLGAAFVLPNNAEYYILGAMEDMLKQQLYSYQTLYGEYRKDPKGKLVFTVLKGLTHGATRESLLPHKITINFGYIS